MFLLFCSLLFFCYCHYTCDMLFIVIPQFLDILFFFLFHLFFFPNCISVLEVSTDKPLFSKILSSAMYDLLMSLLNILFIFGYKVVFKISLIYIFLRILITNLLLKFVYFFSIRVPRILTIVFVLLWPSDIFKCSTISKSSSDSCFLTSNQFVSLPLSMSCNFGSEGWTFCCR